MKPKSCVYQRYGNFIINKSQSLGSGNFGHVWKGYLIIPNPNPNTPNPLTPQKKPNNTQPILQPVAIKQSYNQTQNIKQIQILQILKHRNIIEYKDYRISGNSVFMVMQLCQGGTLDDLLYSYQIHNTQKLINIYSQIIEGIKFMYEKKILHRDIKPSNILVSKFGVIKIADFGTSKLNGSNQLKLRTLVGTPLFFSPQLFEMSFGQEDTYTQKSQIWALGLILYFMFNYQYNIAKSSQRMKQSLPWSGRNTLQIFKNIKNQPLKFKKQAQFYIPQEIKQIIRKMLKINVEERMSFQELFALEIFKKDKIRGKQPTKRVKNKNKHKDISNKFNTTQINSQPKPPTPSSITTTISQIQLTQSQPYTQSPPPSQSQQQSQSQSIQQQIQQQTLTYNNNNNQNQSQQQCTIVINQTKRQTIDWELLELLQRKDKEEQCNQEQEELRQFYEIVILQLQDLFINATSQNIVKINNNISNNNKQNKFHHSHSHSSHTNPIPQKYQQFLFELECIYYQITDKIDQKNNILNKYNKKKYKERFKEIDVKIKGGKFGENPSIARGNCGGGDGNDGGFFFGEIKEKDSNNNQISNNIKNKTIQSIILFPNQKLINQCKKFIKDHLSTIQRLINKNQTSSTPPPAESSSLTNSQNHLPLILQTSNHDHPTQPSFSDLSPEQENKLINLVYDIFTLMTIEKSWQIKRKTKASIQNYKKIRKFVRFQTILYRVGKALQCIKL